MNVTCESFSISAEQQTIFSTKELRGKISIFSPTQLIFEVDSPLSVNLPDLNLGLPINANWDLVRTSFNFADFSFSVVLDSVKFLLGDENEIVSIAKFDTNGGFQGEGSTHGYTFNLDVRDLLPRIIGVEAEQSGEIDIEIHIPVGENLLEVSGEEALGLYLSQGGEVRVKQVRLAMGGFELDLGGELKFKENGYLSGKLSLWIGNYEKLVNLLQSNLPDYAEMINQMLPTIISGFPSLEKNGISGREIPIKVVNGSVTVGVFPIGEIPPLRAEQLMHDENSALN